MSLTNTGAEFSGLLTRIKRMLMGSYVVHIEQDQKESNVNGFSLPICPRADGKRSLADFVDSVYLHPMLDKDSLMVQAVTEINRLFDVAEIPVVADKIEALGSDVALP